MTDVLTEPQIATRAAALGVVDALVFRRVSTDTWVHLGGLGRGAGWAGLIDVDDRRHTLTERFPAHDGSVETFAADVSTHVVGPYYARAGALVRLTSDVVVVLGNPTGQLAPDADHADLHDLAVRVDADVAEVSPSKRLGDELEVLHAVRSMITTAGLDVDATLTNILDVALAALSCEFGIVCDGSGRTVARTSGGSIDPSQPLVRSVVAELMQRATAGSYCLQVLGDDPLDALTGLEPGVRSVLAVPIPQPTGGLLVAAHTASNARGFTDLCQRMGTQLVEAAGVIAHISILRDDARSMADDQFRIARTDALTGLGNRLQWDEAVSAAQLRLDAGERLSVITVDVDGLKDVNDEHGHDVGDSLLRRCSAILRSHARDGDTVVRLGGDEFAILLPLDGPAAERRLAALRGALGIRSSCPEMVGASTGMGTAGPGERIADAVRDADISMYAHKRGRRSRFAGPVLPTPA